LRTCYRKSRAAMHEVARIWHSTCKKAASSNSDFVVASKATLEKHRSALYSPVRVYHLLSIKKHFRFLPPSLELK